MPSSRKGRGRGFADFDAAAAAAGWLAAGGDSGLRGEMRGGGGGRVARYRPRVAPDQSDAGVGEGKLEELNIVHNRLIK